MCYFCAVGRSSFSYDDYAAHGGAGPAAKGTTDSTPATASGTSYPSYVDGLMSGYSWEFSDGTRTITYSFQDDEFDAIDAADGSDDQNDWVGYEETSFVNAFAMISRYVNIDFASSGFRNDDNANFQLFNYNNSWDGWGGSVPLASFYYPQSGSATAGDGQFNRQGEGWNPSGLQIGGYGYVTVFHEIGHGLGLQHPFDPSPNGNGFANYPNMGLAVLDDGLFTAMSYDDKNENWNSFASGQANWASFGQAGTLMAGDIAALQRIYGARTGLSNGNNVYVLPEANAAGTYYSCIYDTGGVDTITAFNHAGAARIDLRPGTQVSKHLATYGGYTIAFDPVGVSGADQVDAWIENAVGGMGADEIVGNQKANDLRGMQGADTIFGETNGKGIDDLFLSKGGQPLAADPRALNLGVDAAAFGNDTLYGGAGNDILVGQGGDDRLYGEEDADILRGDVGADLLEGGTGNDTLFGHLNDVIAGPDDADTLRGGDGLDQLYGEEGNDLLEGGAGQDTLDGGSGNDVLNGGDGPGGFFVVRDDLIMGFSGADTVFGGEGNDEIYGDGTATTPAAAPAADSLNGGGGNDTVDAGGGDDSVDGGTGDDSLKGGEGKDTLLGGAVDNDTLLGEAGDDLLDGGAGNDSILGGADKDSIRGGLGVDTIRGEDGDDTVDGGDGADSIVGGADIVAIGVSDNDSLFGGLGADTIQGGAGADRIDGSFDNDSLRGGAGNDTILGGAVDNDSLYGDAGNDSLDAGAGDDSLEGGDDADTLLGGVGADRLLGQAGNDSLDGGDGLDVLIGGLGDDVYVMRGHETVQEDAAPAGGGKDTLEAHVGFTAVYANIDVFKLMNATANLAAGNELANEMFGNAGNDTLVGRAGNDTLRGGAGQDSLIGSEGADLMNGEGGIDTYVFDGLDTIIDSGSDFGDVIETSVTASLFNANIVGVEHMRAAAGSAKIDLTGNDGANQLTGNEGANRIDGAGGNDTAVGGSGNDTLLGRAGADTLQGGGDNDSLVGGDDDLDLGDRLAGESGNDTAVGAGGADSVTGDAGNDSLFGGAGNDTVDGGTEADLVDGGLGDDSLTGGAGADTLVANGGRDVAAAGVDSDLLRLDWTGIDRAAFFHNGDGDGSTFKGSLAAGYSGVFFADDERYYDRVAFSDVERFDLRLAGRNDYVRTGDGNDTVSGGDGDDTLITLKGVDVVDGGGGVDRWNADKTDAGGPVTLDLNVVSTYLGATVQRIEALTLKTGDSADVIKTFATVAGLTDTLGYNDDVRTGLGADRVTVTGGRDFVDLGADADTLVVDWSKIDRSVNFHSPTGDFAKFDGSLGEGYSGVLFGDDNRYYNRVDFTGVETFDVATGAGNDRVRTGDGNDTISGGDGGDTLITFKGVDVVDGGAGVDRWDADKSDAAASEAIRLDLNLTGVQGTYFGSATVRGIEALTLSTGAGADAIRTFATVAGITDTFGYGDTVVTGAGDDTVAVFGGRDAVDLGADADKLVVDWSLIDRSVNFHDPSGDYSELDGSLAAGYSGVFFGDDDRYYNRVDFAGVERFDVRLGGGNDRLRTGDGDDFVSSGAGGDVVITFKGADTVDGGDGVDRWDADKSDSTAEQAIVLDVNLTGVQSTYFGGATVSGFEALTLKTGAGADVIRTFATVAAIDSSFGYDDTVVSGAGADVVSIYGGRDAIDLGTGADLLVVDWSSINRSVNFHDPNGDFADLDGSLAAGYSGVFFGDDDRYYNRVDFAGVERFDVRLGGGNDRLRTGDGDDFVSTGAGDDTAITFKGVDTVDGGSGVDRWDADKSNAGSTQAIKIDVNLTGVQSTYFGSATVRGFEALTLKTGAGGDEVKTYKTVAAIGDTFGYADDVRTGAGADLVQVNGGRDFADLGAGVDTLVVDWSRIGRSVGFHNREGETTDGSLSKGYSGVFFGDDDRYYNRVEFAGVEKFKVSTGAGADSVRTGDGADTVSGGAGNDWLVTGKGADVVDGGAHKLREGTWGDRWEADKSTASASQAINIDLTKTGVQSTYFGAGTVRGIEMLTLKTGAGADHVKTFRTLVEDLGGDAGYEDVLSTGAGADEVTVTGGRDVVDMGSGRDTLIVDWSKIGRSVNFHDPSGDYGKLAGTFAKGYSGALFGDDERYYNRVDFAGVELFRVTTGVGADRVVTGDGNDTVVGGAGNDLLITGKGADIVDGGTHKLREGSWGDRWEADKSNASASQAIVIDLTKTGVQGTYMGTGSVRGIEALGLKTGAGADRIVTFRTLTEDLGGDAGYEDVLSTGAGADVVKLTGGRDVAEMGSGSDLLILDWSKIDRAANFHSTGGDFSKFDGSLAAGYSGAFFGDDERYFNRVDFTGVERFDLSFGKGADRAQGGDGADSLDGGGGADTMTGGKGDDVYVVDDLGDVVVEGAQGGADTILAEASYVLRAGQQVETLSTINAASRAAIDLTGNAFANKLNGNAGANDLDGGGGADTMTGFAGDDVYFVDNAKDMVVEAANKGADKVVSTVTHALANNVEALELTGAKAINGTGNAGANTLTGNAKANALDGGAGADTIDGGLGIDKLTGGDGLDTFAFSTALGAANVDQVLDFVVKDDTFRLDVEVFEGLKVGKLSSAAFAVGSKAADALDRIIYDKASGALFFDEDGSRAAHAAIQFATLTANLSLNSADFVVIA